MASEREDNDSFAQRIEKRMAASVSAGMDEDVAYDTIAELQVALQWQARRMVAEAKATETCVMCERAPSPPNARDIAHITKALDEVTRLWQFAKGNPDHRSQVTSEDKSVLRALKDWQIAQVWTWVEENATEGSRAE